MNALEQWRSRTMQVRVLDRCDECGQLKEDVQKRVICWSNSTALCCVKCFTEMTGEWNGFSGY
ncbi:hypothetical protein LMG28614_05715 [Paraburkholderia ultramafica]|uniref:Uncharacterized protein n=1 Tax=Paraburkholderia ultramafica TaxID=1544867 RepID=A0A6S7BLB3_9BURK|nr:hypothetical protein LMG28614_05715 [Paraburkholderia ultramafica]